MNQQDTIEEYSPINESFVTIDEQGIKVRVGFQIKNPSVLAGGVVVVDFSIENRANTFIYFLGGSSSSKKRPAHFSFEGKLISKDNLLEDPMQKAVEIGGPVGAIKIMHGETFRQRIVLNQFLTLEDLFNCMTNDEKDTLQIRCFHYLLMGKTKNDILTNTDTLVTNIELGLVVPVERDEKRLINYIQNLTTTLKAGWKANATAEEEITLQKLIALRTPVISEYLEQLMDHPNISFNYQIQSALEVLKNKK